MVKRVQSWSKSEGAPGLIAAKKVDHSVFFPGSVYISRQFKADFVKANGGLELQDREVHPLKLIVEGREYAASLRCNFSPNSAGVRKENLQIRWDGNTLFKDLLKARFQYSHSFILSEQERTGRSAVRLPDDRAEYIDFYYGGAPFTYELRLRSSSSQMMPYPFSNIFATAGDAEWFFKVLREMLHHVGITSHKSEFFSVAYHDKENTMCVNLQAGQLLSIRKSPDARCIVSIACEDASAQLHGLQRSYSYKHVAQASSLGIYDIEFQTLMNDFDTYRPMLRRTWESVGKDFLSHKVAPDPASSTVLAEAIFDEETLRRILTGGLGTAHTRTRTSHKASVDRMSGRRRGLKSTRNQDRKPQRMNQVVGVSQCAEALSLDEDKVNRMISAIERKGQAIFYGPPGTGKTYAAREMARVIMSGGDGILDIVQFHPSYTYEEFIVGIKPITNENGTFSYQSVDGLMVDFCRRAKERTGNSVLIIDEINRANISRVFGELYYLLEYRDKAISLSNGSVFSFPNNVYILGTMNTADRSIAVVDHALRRRFAFIELGVNYSLLKKYHEGGGFPVETLIAWIDRVNRAIADKRYFVGTSYFLHQNLAEHIQDIWTMEIIPYLEEFFFDQPEKLDEFSWDDVEDTLYAQANRAR